MCTASLIPLPDGLRLVFNRDESRTRAPGLPPAWHDLPHGLRAIWPTDPAAGGTWIAASTRGLVLAVMNYNLEPPPSPPGSPASRGSLIPRLIDALSPALAAQRLDAMDLAPFPPFRMLAADPGSVLELRWDRARLERVEPGRPPLCWASSGLGDSRVRPRLPLFEERVARDPTPGAQDAFHRHAWPDRPEISVRMSRAEARTVSITTVQVLRSATPGRFEVRMDTEPIP